MKRNLFITLSCAVLGSAAHAATTASNFEANNSYNAVVDANGTAANIMVFYTRDGEGMTLATDETVFTISPDADTPVTAVVTSAEARADGAKVLVSPNAWGYSRSFESLTIEKLTATNATLGIYEGTQGSTLNVTVKKIEGTLSKIENTGTLTIGGTVTGSDTMELIGAIRFDTSDLSRYTLVSGEGLMAPTSGTNGFAGSGTYALIIGYSTLNSSGATLSASSGTINIGDNAVTVFIDGLYYIQDGSTVGLDAIKAQGSVSDVIVSSGTLNLNASGLTLDHISGAGNVQISADTTIAGGTSSVATGSLVLSSGRLTVGSSDSTEASLSSFSSVVLDGGELYYNNKQDTLHNVSVAQGKTATITSYDMGRSSDNAVLQLADETNVAGALTIQNQWNAQIRIEQLTGAGELYIKGINTSGAIASSSAEAAEYTIGLDGFTGTIHIENSSAAVCHKYNSFESFTSSRSYTVEGGTVQGRYDGALNGGTYDLGVAEGTLFGAISNATINGGSGSVTIQGTISGSTINGADHVSINTSSIGTGTTLNEVTLGGSNRKNLSGTVTLGNVRNNATGGSFNYALVGGSNVHLVITGDTNTTMTSDGSENAYAAIGLSSGSMVTVKQGASLTASRLFNTNTDSSNTSVTVEEGGTLVTTGINSTIVNLTNHGVTTLADNGTKIAGDLVNSGTLTLSGADFSISNVTLSGGSVTLGTEEAHNHNLTITGSLGVQANSRLNANLVMAGGNISFENSAVLTLGCTLDLGEGVKIVLSDQDIASLDSGSSITLFESVETMGRYLLDGGDIRVYSASDLEQATAYKLSYSGDATNGYTLFVGASVPEPATATLSLLALAGLCARRRRR
ncbi:MAG: PEP-CTERM sorting domain-containing protein [Akkermansia sp.]